MTPLDEWYTVAEVAQALRVSVRGVHKFIREKRLEARTVGRGYRISAAAVEAFMASQPERVRDQGHLVRPQEKGRKDE